MNSFFSKGQVYNESSIFSVEDQTNTKQTINNKDMVDTAHDQKDAGDQKTPKRVSFMYFYLFNVTFFNLIFPS